jgi:CRISPR/Cas system-associated protein endoribonuclease Cas2
MLCVVIGLFSVGCTVKRHVMEYPPKTETEKNKKTIDMHMTNDKLMTVEEIAREAYTIYERVLKDGNSKEQAVNKVGEFLRAQKNISLVVITGSDTIKVIFTDGNDLLMLLGRERL